MLVVTFVTLRHVRIYVSPLSVSYHCVSVPRNVIFRTHVLLSVSVPFIESCDNVIVLCVQLVYRIS